MRTCCNSELGPIQLQPGGDYCHICNDGGYRACECHHNPLAMANRAAAANAHLQGNALAGRCFRFRGDRPVPLICPHVEQDFDDFNQSVAAISNSAKSLSEHDPKIRTLAALEILKAGYLDAFSKEQLGRHFAGEEA